MKTPLRSLALLTLLTFISASSVLADLVIPSDGTDRELRITNNTVIDLSRAITGVWSNKISEPDAGRGIYDPEKWAVVFKYSSVVIASNVTVTFRNHESHAPVVWLVNGDVVINGAVSLDGASPITTDPGYRSPTEPGPGGFRGGAYGPEGMGWGMGPGGGHHGDPRLYNCGGTGGAYLSSYGSPQIVPLIGGSGAPALSGNGGAAGGAILIAASKLVVINGQISANGSWTPGGYCIPGYNVHASSGAVRIIADSILGTGSISAVYDGRTRMEANSLSADLQLTPITVAVPPGATPIIWPHESAADVRILSVDSQRAPPDPRAGLSTATDINISLSSSAEILLETKRFPTNGIVAVRISPKYSAGNVINASFISGDFSRATWRATATFLNGFAVLQAHAKAP